MKKITIIGAGLAGLILASKLQEFYEVTVINLDARNNDDFIDQFYPRNNRTFSYGLGGTTKLWHNGLIEIDKLILDKYWPGSSKNINHYYEEAFNLLSGESLFKIKNIFLSYLKSSIFKDVFSTFIYYPHVRFMANKLDISKCHYLSKTVVSLKIIDNNVESILFSDGTFFSDFDICILAAGGLNTPLILQSSIDNNNIGANYEDHPACYIGKLSLLNPTTEFGFLRLNTSIKASLRVPIVIESNSILFSFQLRPTLNSRIATSSNKIKSYLSDLRNNYFSPKIYLKFILNLPDIIEYFSFKCALNFKIKNYDIFMVGQQRTSNNISIYSSSGNKILSWDLTTYEYEANVAISKFQSIFSKFTDSFIIYSDWKSNIFSSAHHSGSCRISDSSVSGVCDANLNVFGVNNLFVCDGSVIPASGISNTGLTIAALSLRLVNFIKAKYK